MKRRGGSRETAALRTYWCRWVDIVELFARRLPARGRVDPREYGVLHKELIRNCETLAATANEVEATFYRYLEDLARPWLTPVILARSDHDILVNLLMRCRQADRQLGGRAGARLVPRWVLWALLGSCLVAVPILAIGSIEGLWYPSMNHLRGWSDELWIAAKRSNDTQRLFCVGVILVVVSVIAVSRTAKS